MYVRTYVRTCTDSDDLFRSVDTQHERMASSMQADPTHNGAAIPAWTETAKEYLVLEKFPNLRNRLKNGLDCLEEEERVSLGTLIQERRTEQKTTNHKPLHHKVSLLAGGNLAHVAADAVVNASNHWLGTGKGN